MTSCGPPPPPPSCPAPQLEGLHQVQFRLVREGGLRRLVALRDLSPGQVIFTETPLASGPGDREGVCTVCYSPLGSSLCSRCWWPVCPPCSSSPAHSTECRLLAACVQRPGRSCLPTPHLLPLRLLLLREQGGRDWDTVTTLASECASDSLLDTRELLLFLKEDCGLAVSREEVLMLIRLQSSTIGLTVQGRQVPALYPTAALLPHSCSPNTRAVYRRAGHKLILHASTHIKRGETLTLSRLRNQELLLTGSHARRQLLGGQACPCARCQDPSELGTHMSSILCQHCPSGLCLPSLPSSPWVCRDCSATLQPHFVSTLLLSLQSEDTNPPSSQEELEAFLQPLAAILPANHFMVTKQKARYFFHPASSSPAEYWARVTTGRQLLLLADTLEPGLSAAREAILVTLGMCLQFLLGSEVMLRLGGDQDQGLLTDSQMFAAFRDAAVCFREALTAARLEEDPDDPEKTPTVMIQTNLQILEEMKAEFENMKL